MYFNMVYERRLRLNLKALQFNQEVVEKKTYFMIQAKEKKEVIMSAQQPATSLTGAEHFLTIYCTLLSSAATIRDLMQQQMRQQLLQLQ